MQSKSSKLWRILFYAGKLTRRVLLWCSSHYFQEILNIASWGINFILLKAYSLHFPFLWNIKTEIFPSLWRMRGCWTDLAGVSVCITGEDTDCIAPSTDRLLSLVKFWHLRSQYNQDDAAAHIASPSHSHVTCTASQAAAYYLSAFPSTKNLHTSHLSHQTSHLLPFTFQTHTALLLPHTTRLIPFTSHTSHLTTLTSHLTSHKANK